MRALIKLSFRNVFRQKRRSRVTIIAGAVGVVGLLFYFSLMNGMMYEMIHSALGFRLPAVSIEKIEKGKHRPFRFPVALRKEIRSMSGVHGVSGRLIRDSMMVSADLSVTAGARGVRLFGVDPMVEREVTDAAHLIEEQKGGEWLSDYDPEEPGMVIGESLAEKMRVGVGDMVIVTVLQTVEEEKRMENARAGDVRIALFVKGIFRSNDSSFEKNYAFVHRGFLLAFEPAAQGDLVHQIAVRTNPEDAKNVSLAIRESFATTISDTGLSVLSWEEKDSLLYSNISMFDVFNQILLFIVLSASSFVVVNTMLMVVQERFREFGILKAIGAGGLKIGTMILLEGMILALLGVALGIAVGVPLVALLYLVGIDMGGFGDALGEIGLGQILYPYLRIQDLIFTTLTASVFAWMGSLIPAFRAARIRPLDAIQFK